MSVYQYHGIDTTMGQPRTVSITIENQKWRELDKIARGLNRSKADLIRPLILKYIEEHTGS